MRTVVLYVFLAGIGFCLIFEAFVEPQVASGFIPAFIWNICRLGAVLGTIWLGWYLKNLNKKFAFLANAVTALSKPGGVHNRTKDFIKPADISETKKVHSVHKAIERELADFSKYKETLEQQITDLKLQLQLSQRQKTNIEAIIYGIRDAVIVIDQTDRLLIANESAGRIFNFNFKNSQHKPMQELIKDLDEQKRQFLTLLRQCRQSKAKATRYEITLNGQPQQEPQTFECIISCVYDSAETQRVCGVVAVLHDITREKEISQMKNDFVSAASHELKTPLASIMAYSEMLVDGEAQDNKTKEEFYSVIQSQAKRLSRLIEDMLNISRIESGLIKVEKRPVSLTILIEQQLQMIRSYADEKNIEVISQKPIVFDQVHADKDMISQVIVNLLSNAVKYTQSGGSVSIKTEVDEIDKTARVSITDTGLGIPEDEIEHIFDKFYRVGANSKKAKGTGLGLNLVKQIVEKVHDGRIFVESKVGEGSTFGFELPIATAETVQV
ncbi:MAG: PAS domain-containing protein [Sedimentisphaerales bacterium]|nr:PAS domain-containing protein [Sedimentisphaerales bacterium]